ncbi:hypothetical protein H0H93_010532 [Arthromyces matolae]|nr:hypothetical protein H0H93_010532 [Arthromyces matolae]
MSDADNPSFYATNDDDQHGGLPKVGQTRCYWALLDSELHFVYLDPVLQSHLEEQSSLLRGKSLLDFVHPDEYASARIDLGGVLDSRTLHGSVTRVRFSRLSRVRRLLGYEGPPAPWQDADKIALDNNYMAVDIVINWAAEGLVLCFIHAIVDLSPTDNDETHKSSWTNWCGTPRMETNQIQMCYNYLIASVPAVPHSAAMTRVFQILDNKDGRNLLLSWPPDQGTGTATIRPNARDFAQLVENAQIGPNDQQQQHQGNDAKTSCSVIFACHKVLATPSSSSSRSSISAATMQQQQLAAYPQTASPSSSYSYYDSSPSAYPLPPLSTAASAYPSYAYAPQRWTGEAEYTSSQQQHAHAQAQQWASSSPSPAHNVSSLPPVVSNLRAGSYPPPLPPAHPTHPSQPHHPHPHAHQTPFAPGAPFLEVPRPGSPYGSTSGAQGSYSPGQGSDISLPGDDMSMGIVPQSRRRASPSSARGGEGVIPGGRHGHGAQGGHAGNRPNGVLKCSSCKATSSPEWRKGPSGKKELCNACGLRYARSRAKKEGQSQTQRRRKEKSTSTVVGGGISKRELSSTPPYMPGIPGTSASAPAGSSMPLRMGTSPSSGAPLSVSVGSAGYSRLEDTNAGLRYTPSPSPPMSFMQYRPPHGHGGHASGQFYGVPSPLSNTIPLDDESIATPSPGSTGSASMNGSGDHAMGANGNRSHSQLLPSMATYVGRSPLSTMPAASYERDRGERDKERDLPPPLALPLPVETKFGRRVLAQQG